MTRIWHILFYVVITLAATAHESSAEELSNTSKEVESIGLEDAIGIALEKNYEILKAKARIEQQQNVIIEARSAYFPSVGVEGKYDQVDEKRLPALNGQVFGSDRNWTVDIRAINTVYSGGRDTANFRRQKFLEEAAVREFEAVVNDVILQVKTRFYAVLLAKSKVNVQKQNIALLEEELRFEKSRLDAGTVSEFNVLQAEVALANGRTPFIKARNDLKLAFEEMRRVLGIGTDDSAIGNKRLKLLGKLKFEPFNIQLNEALNSAEKDRPELKRSKLVVEAEKQGVRMERAAYLPSLSIFGGYGADKSRFSDDLDDNERGWFAGAQTSWNIFDGLRTNARVDQARAAQSIARLNHEEILDAVNIEVRRVYSSLVESRELVRVSEKVVEQAEESVRLARARAEAGAGTQLDTLNSQVQLTQARTNHIQALYEYNVAVASMLKALGWQKQR